MNKEMKNKIKEISSKKWFRFGMIAVAFVILVNIVAISGLKSQVRAQQTINSDLAEEISNSENIANVYSSKLITVQEAYDEEISAREKAESEYEKYKNRMKPYEELEEAEAKARQIEADKKAEEESKIKAEEEKAREEAEKQKREEEKLKQEEEKRKKEEEEKRGYETGITYDQLARDPDTYMANKVQFYGKVIQVMEDDYSTELRFAVDDNYDQIIYLNLPVSAVSGGRILEDDYITIMGTSMGLLDYETVFGAKMTIPAVDVDKVER